MDCTIGGFQIQHQNLDRPLLGEVMQTELDNNESRTTDTTIVSSSEFVVTNLVADIREFSEFSQDRASSKVCEFIKEIFDRFSAILDLG
jgi:hypothetical protein